MGRIIVPYNGEGTGRISSSASEGAQKGLLSDEKRASLATALTALIEGKHPPAFARPPTTSAPVTPRSPPTHRSSESPRHALTPRRQQQTPRTSSRQTTTRSTSNLASSPSAAPSPSRPPIASGPTTPRTPRTPRAPAVTQSLATASPPPPHPADRATRASTTPRGASAAPITPRTPPYRTPRQPPSLSSGGAPITPRPPPTPRQDQSTRSARKAGGTGRGGQMPREYSSEKVVTIKSRSESEDIASVAGESPGGATGRKQHDDHRMNAETEWYIGRMRLREPDNIASLLQDPRVYRQDDGHDDGGNASRQPRVRQTLINSVRARQSMQAKLSVDKPLSQVGFATQETLEPKHKKPTTACKSKPCVSVSDGAAAGLGWNHEGNVAIEYSDTYMTQFRDQMAKQHQSSKSDATQRDCLPGFVKPRRNDGCMVKPLVGNPHPGEHPYLPHRIPLSKASLLPVYDATSYQCNRTVSYHVDEIFKYQSRAATCNGMRKTDATDWRLDAAQAIPEEPKTPPTTAERQENRKHVDQRLSLHRALRGAPSNGKSLIPVKPATATMSIKDLLALSKPQFTPLHGLRPQDYVRPNHIRATAALRAQIKVARRALREKIAKVPVPEWSAGSKNSSALSTAYLVPNLWHAYLGADLDGNGRLEVKDFEKLLEKIGIEGMSHHDCKMLFNVFDVDHSGGLDWSEFSHLFITSASKV